MYIDIIIAIINWRVKRRINLQGIMEQIPFSIYIKNEARICRNETQNV